MMDKKEKEKEANEEVEKNNIKEITDNKKNEIKDSNTADLIKSEEIEIDEKKLKKINEEIKANKKKSRNNEFKNEKYIRILRNVVIAVVGIAYISIALMGTKRIPTEQYQVDLKVFILLSVIAGIILFEKAFKTDKLRFALLGIEVLVMGGATIILLNLYKNQNYNILKYSKYYILLWIIYYIIKNIIIAVKRTEIDKKEAENN